jgi:putative SOS response-associated peptidase YedK
MCGRYCITSAPEAIRRLFRYPEQPNFPPRYNVAPTQPVPIVRMEGGERHFALVRWGLIPSWVKDPKGFSLLINARGETVNDKPAFRNAMKRRRCLFPADGFYEWKGEGAGKRPYFARPVAGGPVAYAGLWETWIGPNGEEMDTAAIVTTQANAEMATVHHRAPVMVPPEQFDFWLDCANVDEKLALEALGPAPDGSMEVYEISSAVNRVANDSPKLLEPHSAADDPSPEAENAQAATGPSRKKSDPRQGSLF